MNNHHRFVRAHETDSLTFPKYEQDSWVELQHYNTASWETLIALWRLYNHQLAHIIKNIKEDKLGVICTIGSYEPVTLQFLVEDYLDHMMHHLKDI